MFVGGTNRALFAVAMSAILTTASLAQAAEVGSLGRGGIAVAHGQLAPSVQALAFKKKRRPAKSKGPRLTPESAEEKRQAIRAAAQADLDTERWSSAADTLETNAAILGDPVTFLEAGEARLQLAERERSLEEAERSIATTRVALDILHFYQSVAAGETSSDWLVIDPDDASGYVARAAEQIAAAETLIETIEREQAGDDVVADGPRSDKKKRDRVKRPGTGMIAAGAAFTAVGVAGVTMVIAGVAIGASKQNEVEDLMPGVDDEEIDRLDDAGARANRIAFVGTGLAVVGLAVGIPLVVFGVKKRRASAGSSATARLRVTPALGPQLQGLTISGRF